MRNRRTIRRLKRSRRLSGLLEKQHSEYDKARINLVVGAIWYKVYSKDRRECAVLAEALHRS